MQERLAYEVYLNIKLVRIFSSGAHLGEVETEKSTITLKYATDAERICTKLQVDLYEVKEYNLQVADRTDCTYLVPVKATAHVLQLGLHGLDIAEKEYITQFKLPNSKWPKLWKVLSLTKFNVGKCYYKSHTYLPTFSMDMGGGGGVMTRHSGLLWRVIGSDNNFFIICTFWRILKNV